MNPDEFYVYKPAPGRPARNPQAWHRREGNQDGLHRALARTTHSWKSIRPTVTGSP